MMKTPNPKMAAWMGLVAAALIVATMYFPALKPVCQAFGGCMDEAVIEQPVQ